MSAKPKNSPWITPYVGTEDVEKAIIFYTNSYGFELIKKIPGQNGEAVAAELSYQGQWIMIGKINADGSGSKTPAQSGSECPLSLYFYTENVDKFYEAAVAAGATSLCAPDDECYGDRVCRLKDPDGYTWYFATNLHEHPEG